MGLLAAFKLVFSRSCRSALRRALVCDVRVGFVCSVCVVILVSGVVLALTLEHINSMWQLCLF